MTIVETTLGRVQGARTADGWSFLGLPYAAPPVGPRRWRPPEPAAPWSGVRDGSLYPNRAPQEPLPDNLLPVGGLKGRADEDCLYLNVHTPAADTARRPVLVWIHGGGYRLGSGNDTDFSRWVRDYDTVVVSINYRLGMLGFLDLSRYGEAFKDTASLGFQDQIAALRWVATNIASFGGDPERVTLIGGSAGAGAVLALLSAPTAQGLFHRAIAISPLEIFATPPDAIGHLARVEGVTETELVLRLQNSSADEIVKLQSDNGYAIHGLFQLAAADGDIIVAPPADGIRSGISRVPLIAGATAEEGAMIAAQIGDDPAFGTFFEADMAAATGGGDPARYTRFLDRLLPHAGPTERMTRAYFDHFRASAVRVAQAAAENGAPAWVYSFEAPTEHPFGATHGADIRFVTNSFDPDGPDEVWFYRNTPSNRRIGSEWSAALARFAATGDPNGGALPLWPEYRPDARVTLAIRSEFELVRDLDDADALAAYGLAPPRGVQEA